MPINALMDNSLGIFFALCGAVSIASTAIFVRIATRNGGKAFYAVIVSLIMNLIIVIPVVAVVYYPDYGITLKSAIAFTGAGLAGTLIGRVAYFEGIQRVGASRSDAIKATTPIIATIIAIVLIGESPSRIHIIGIIAIVVGVWIISLDLAPGKTVEGITNKRIDVIYPIAAAIFFGFEPVFARIGVLEGTPGHVGLSIKLIVAGIGFLAYFIVKGDIPNIGKVFENKITAKWYILAGLASTSMMVFLYAAIEVAPVVFVVPILQTSPLFVVVFSYIWLQDIEHISWRLVIGILIMICATIIITTVA
jgi:uncharacterized membrane protein